MQVLSTVLDQLITLITECTSYSVISVSNSCQSAVGAPDTSKELNSITEQQVEMPVNLEFSPSIDEIGKKTIK